MKRISQHKMLLAANSYAQSSEAVQRFFELTSLVRYDCIEIRKELSFSALDTDFFARISRAEENNHLLVQGFVNELENAGIKNSRDLAHIEQGYLSKTFHVLSHFLDGFIGIDSFFYNLIDDSHWLPAATAALIRENPGHYWLLHLDCFSLSPEEAGMLHLQRPGRTTTA